MISPGPLTLAIYASRRDVFWVLCIGVFTGTQMWQLYVSYNVSLVRPHLEYAAPVWSPYLQKDSWPAHTVGQVGQWPYHFFQDPYIPTSHPLPLDRGGSGGGSTGGRCPPLLLLHLSSLLTCCRCPGLA